MLFSVDKVNTQNKKSSRKRKQLILYIFPAMLFVLFGAVSCGDTKASSSGSAILQVSAGTNHTCVLLSGGAVRCWGAGSNLGYANTDNIGDDEDPATVGEVNVGGTVTQIVTGSNHTCALLSTGAVRCWGGGSSGRLGYGNTDNIGDDEEPITAGDINIGGTVTGLAAGNNHTCALLSTGSVRCWGQGGSGRLGYGNTDDIGDDEDPATAGDVNVGGTVTQVVAGGDHTCALLSTGSVRCWGQGSLGRTGYGNTDDIGDDEDPATAGDVNIGGGTVDRLEAGHFHTCALLNSGAVRCWGSGLFARLGYGNTDNIGDDEDPATAGDVNIGGTVTQVAAGSEHTCVILTTGSVRCWGEGDFGRTGYGNTVDIGDDEDPATAGDVNIGAVVTQISSRSAHTCALLSSGTVRCWGSGNLGVLGYGNTNSIGDDEVPASAGDVRIQ